MWQRLSAGVPVEAPRFLTHNVFPMSRYAWLPRALAASLGSCSSAFSNFRETRTRFQPAAPRTVSRGFLSDNTEKYVAHTTRPLRPADPFLSSFPKHVYDGPGAVYTGASAVRPGYAPSRQAVRESANTAKRVLNARQAHRTGRFKGGPYV